MIRALALPLALLPLFIPASATVAQKIEDLEVTILPVVARAKVKSGSESIALKDGKVYVRCYDMDYVFEIRKR